MTISDLLRSSSGDVFYVLESGQCDVLKNGQRVATILPGKAFGELALLNNATRQASIRACKVCHLWCLTRQQFREVAAAQEAQQLEERVRFLSEVDLFSRLLPSALEMIAQVMELRAYAEGERIVRQGDSGPHLAFYMIQSGRVVVTQSSLLKGGSSELVRLGPGKYFGELALMDNSPRKATVSTCMINSLIPFTLFIALAMRCIHERMQSACMMLMYKYVCERRACV